jgi:G3E family GTPase
MSRLRPIAQLADVRHLAHHAAPPAGDRVLRLKGLLNVGAGRGPLLMEGVQHVIHVPRHLREWPDGGHRSRIVSIARDLDLAQVEVSLEAFQDLAAAV